MTQLIDRLRALCLILLFGLWMPRVVMAQATGEFLCNGGTNAGKACQSDDDCPPNGVCVISQGVCSGGGDDGLTCQCLGGSCPTQPLCSTDATMGMCSGGLFSGQCCDPSYNCADSAPCDGTAKVCLSGTNQGFPCLQNSQCPSSTCGYTNKFCAGVCQGGQNVNQLCLDDTDCPSSTCDSSFQSDSCVADSDCCGDPSATPAPSECTAAGICRGPATSTSPTPTPPRGSPTPTRTRTGTRTPTGSRTPGTPTPTPPAAATATPTPSATRATSPVTTAHLASAVTATDSSISVDNASAFPDAGTFQVDSEQIAYTSKFGNTFINVRRGVNGTTAAAHVSGALVLFLSTTVPTPPRPTPTSVPRDVIYQTIGDGSGCALQTDGSAGTSTTLLVAGLMALVLRRRR